MFRRYLLAAGLAAGLAPLPALAQTQTDWPTKPVRIISPFPAGGTSDVMARMLSAALSKELAHSSSSRTSAAPAA